MQQFFKMRFDNKLEKSARAWLNLLRYYVIVDLSRLPLNNDDGDVRRDKKIERQNASTTLQFLARL